MIKLFYQTSSARFSRLEQLPFPSLKLYELVDFAFPFMFSSRNKMQKCAELYLSILGNRISECSMHGVFIDIFPDSMDPLIRKVSISRIRENLSFAEKLGIRKIIFHSGFNPQLDNKFYRDSWLDKNTSFWKSMLEEFSGTIFMENMFESSPENLVSLLSSVNSEKFRCCLDIGHCNCFSELSLTEWVSALSPFTEYYHLNDNSGKSDEHLSLGTGTVNWKHFSELYHLYTPEAVAVLELRAEPQIEESVIFIQENNIFQY